MKKLTALLLTAALCFSLTACTSSNPSASTAPAANSSEPNSNSAEPAPAANWPTDTVTFTVPASPGGGTDTQARIVADYLQRTTGVAFNVVNDTTGGNTVALENARHAKPDGTNLLFFHTSPLMSYYQGKIDFNPLDEYTIITSVGQQADGAICVPANAPYDTGEEFIAYAKEHPGELTFGGTLGGNSQAMIQTFFTAAGVDVNLVDAGNEADWVTAMMAGSIDVCMLTPTTALQHIEAGNFKPLIVTGPAPSDLFPGLPCFADFGCKDIWTVKFFIFGPKDLDEGVVTALNDLLKDMENDKDAMDKILNSQRTPFTYQTHEDAEAEYAQLAETAKSMSEMIGFDVSGK